MYELIYDNETLIIAKADVVVAGVYTAAHPDFYTTLRFDTEAEMRDYIDEHNLVEVLNETY